MNDLLAFLRSEEFSRLPPDAKLRHLQRILTALHSMNEENERREVVHDVLSPETNWRNNFGGASRRE